jgi:hypothetical protein
MSAIIKHKADNLLGLLEEVNASSRQPRVLRSGDAIMKLWILALWIFISGGILSGICTSVAHAGALNIYEMANPSDTGYAGAGLAARAEDAGTVFTNPARKRVSRSLTACRPSSPPVTGSCFASRTTGVSRPVGPWTSS